MSMLQEGPSMKKNGLAGHEELLYDVCYAAACRSPVTLFPRRFAGEPAGCDGLLIFPYFVDQFRSHVVYVDEGVFCVRITFSSIRLEDVVVFNGEKTSHHPQ